MKFSAPIVAALAATPLVAAAPAPYPKVEKKWVDTSNSGFTGTKMPAHFVTSMRKIAREKSIRKRQLDQILGQLTGGAGGGAGGAGGLDQLLGGLTGGAGGAAGGAGGAGGIADLVGGLAGGAGGKSMAAAAGTGATTGAAGNMTKVFFNTQGHC